MAERRSWRNIDRSRGSKGSDQGRFRVHTPATPRGYKADLNKLFDKGEVPKRFKDVMSSASTGATERQQLIRELRSTETEAEFHALLGKFVEAYELPEDEDLLSRAVDHPDEAVVRKALDALIETDARRPLKRRAVLKARLQTVLQVAKEGETIDLAEMLNDRM